VFVFVFIPCCLLVFWEGFVVCDMHSCFCSLDYVFKDSSFGFLVPSFSIVRMYQGKQMQRTLFHTCDLIESASRTLWLGNSSFTRKLCTYLLHTYL